MEREMGHQIRNIAVGLSLVGATLGCGVGGTDPNGNGNLEWGEVVALNSVGRTITQYDINGTLTSGGATVTLPASYNGDAVDVLGRLAVVTNASNGQIVWSDLATGATGFSAMPASSNPGKPSLFNDFAGNDFVLVPGRANNDLWIAVPDDPNAILFSDDNSLGEFVVRVLPAAGLFAAVDANLNDSGDYQPLGDARVVVIDAQTGGVTGVLSLAGARNITDAFFAGELLVVLAGGTIGPAPDFTPAGDGILATVAFVGGIPDPGISLPIGGNGISFEGGRDGAFYITRTSDFETIDVLVFSGFTREWIRGPNNPLQPKDQSGANLNCWVVTGLSDGRLLCGTFETSQNGRLVLLESDGTYIAELASGFGTTDIGFPAR
jgi:hypothetical protein